MSINRKVKCRRRRRKELNAHDTSNRINGGLTLYLKMCKQKLNILCNVFICLESKVDKTTNFVSKDPGVKFFVHLTECCVPKV